MGIMSTLIAGSGAATTTDGTGLGAAFKGAGRGIVADSIGAYVYVTEGGGGNTIRKVETATGVVTTLAGSGVASSLDGTGLAATFNVPQSIAIDHTDTNLYVVEETGSKIRKVVISSGVVTTVASPGGFLEGAAIDSTDSYIYFCGYGTHTIKRANISTGVVNVVAGSGSAGGADGTGTGATFNNPRGIVIDHSGLNLYVIEVTGNRVRKVVLNGGGLNAGTVTTVAGSGAASNLDGTGTAASFSAQINITIDPTDTYLYVGMRRITIATGVVITMSGLIGGPTTGGFLRGSPELTTFYETDANRVRRLDIMPTRFNNTGIHPRPFAPGLAR